MKKIFFLLLIVWLSTLEVCASVNLENIHRNISIDNNLKIKSIAIDYYKDTENYKTCIKNKDNDSNYCLGNIYKNIVLAHINKNVEKINNIAYDVNSCDITNNTCKISLIDNSNNTNKLEKSYTISFIGEYIESITDKANKFVNSLKKDYYIDDMEYINQLINYTNEYNSLNYNNDTYLNIFLEFKSLLEKNADLDYVIVKQDFDEEHGISKTNALIVTYFNDIAISISENINYYISPYIYISNSTKNTDSEYIKTAEKRIKSYLNNDKYKVTITYDEKFDYCKIYAKDNYCNLNSFVNDIFKDSKDYTAKAYKLTINGNNYYLGILPVDSKKIKNKEFTSLNVATGVEIATTSSNVPLDSKLDVKDVTIEYNKDDFYKIYDISLYSSLKNGYMNEFDDNIEIKIPLLDKYNKKVINIYTIKEDGSTGDKYEAKVEIIDNKKYAVFTTKNLTVYGIDKVSKNDVNNIEITKVILIIVVLISVILGVFFTKKRINKKNLVL